MIRESDIKNDCWLFSANGMFHVKRAIRVIESVTGLDLKSSCKIVSRETDPMSGLSVKGRFPV